MTKQSFQRQNKDEEYKTKKTGKAVQKMKKSQSVQKQVKNSSKWTHEENTKFLEFVKSNKEILICPIKRKDQRVFIKLSQFIITRTPDQCRSHHQKMIKHHNDLQGIIQNLQIRLSNYITNKQNEKEKQKNLNEEQKKVEMVLFNDTKLDMGIESFQSREKELWGILNEMTWKERPTQLLLEN